MGRELQAAGRASEAVKVLKRLAGFRELPANIAEECHARLADMNLARKRYRQARRHLTVVLSYRPSVARYYYLFAGAVHHDPRADTTRAIRYYEQAIQLEGNQPRYWSDFGRLLLQLGRTEEGVKALRTAVEIDRDDAVSLARLVEGLCLDGQAGEAREALRAARFRHPKDARFRKLWNDFQFQQLHDSQAGPPVLDEPTILPFVRRAALPEVPKAPGRRIRLDRFSKPQPHLPRPAWLPDHKHAP
jgi:tetratricopeptide (TPR) repeat protein